jgi:hypothetical protein
MIAQYVVRQLELYTEVKRDRLFTKLIKVSKFAERLSIFFFFDSFITNDIELIHTEKKNDITLPKEIITRRKERGDRLIQFTIFLLLFLATSYVWILGTLCYAILLILEYLLCTTSLPPGEKEARKKAKETRSLTPQVT